MTSIFFIGTTPKIVLIIWWICVGTLSIFMEMLMNSQSFKCGGISLNQTDAKVSCVNRSQGLGILSQLHDLPEMFFVIINFIEIYTRAHFVAISILSIPNYFEKARKRRSEEAQFANYLTLYIIDIYL